MRAACFLPAFSYKILETADPFQLSTDRKECFSSFFVKCIHYSWFCFWCIIFEDEYWVLVSNDTALIKVLFWRKCCFFLNVLCYISEIKVDYPCWGKSAYFPWGMSPWPFRSKPNEQKMIHSWLYTAISKFTPAGPFTAEIQAKLRFSQLFITRDLDLLGQHLLNKKWSTHGYTSLYQNSIQLVHSPLEYRPKHDFYNCLLSVTCDLDL